MKLTLSSQYAWALIIALLGAFIALFFSAQAGFFFLLFSCIAWWIWQWPEQGFQFLIILLPILPMFKITQTIGTFSLIKDVIILTLFFRTFAIPLLTKKLEYRRNILIAPLIALVAWACFAALRADSLILGVLRLRDIVLYILLYVGILYLPHSRQIMKQRLVWLLSSFTITLLLSVWQWFFAQDSAVLRFDPVRQIWIPRLSSTLAHPSIFGEYVITIQTLLLPLVLFLKNKKWQILFGIFYAVSLPAMFLSYSRAVWMAFVFSSGVIALVYLIFLATQRISKTKLIGIAVSGGVTALVLCIPLLLFTPAGGLVRSIVDPTYGSNEERLTFFVRLIAPVKNVQAVVGLGLGDVLQQNFRDVNLGAYDIASGASRAVQLTKNSTLVDNQYLKTFVEMGVIGLVLYGWVYWRLFQSAVKQIVQKGLPSEAFIIPTWQLAFLAAFLLQSFFIDIWDIFPTNALFWIVAALFSQQVDTDKRTR